MAAPKKKPANPFAKKNVPAEKTGKKPFPFPPKKGAGKK